MATDPNPQARQSTIDRLVCLLQMNPVHQAAEIISLRSEGVELPNTIGRTPWLSVDALRANRRRLMEQIESIRSKFWGLSDDELNRALDAVDTPGFVDVQTAVARLRTVAAHRAQFNSLRKRFEYDSELLYVLNSIFIRSPKDTGLLREEVLSAFRKRSSRRRGQRVLQSLKAEIPAIYALEADWFAMLGRQKSHLPSIRLKSNVPRRPTRVVRKPITLVRRPSNPIHLIAYIVVVAAILIWSIGHNLKKNNFRPEPIDLSHFSDYKSQVPSAFRAKRYENDVRTPSESKAVPHFQHDKRVWEPYPERYSIAPHDQLKPRPSIENDNPFAQPNTTNPRPPSTESDDRYSR
ncbi:MAG TPA: hypothetical protein VFW73_03705 [Lacipirellulaceae bacterium]|nr:hypothetical protein [Lacipirellulaceae bacterium]